MKSTNEKAPHKNVGEIDPRCRRNGTERVTKKRMKYFLFTSELRGGEVKKYLDLPEVTEYVQGGKMKGKTEMKKKRRHLITK
jgi:hypothetical protein